MAVLCSSRQKPPNGSRRRAGLSETGPLPKAYLKKRADVGIGPYVLPV